MAITNTAVVDTTSKYIVQSKGIGDETDQILADGEKLKDSYARIIREGTIVFNGKIGSIFREKNQAKQVSAGLECGITIKNFNDFQKKDIIEVYNSTVTERTI